MIRLYRAATVFAWPLAKLIMRHRVKTGKEDGRRVGERFGEASVPRPSGPVIWVHAASIGETMSILPLVTRLLGDFQLAKVLITTGTVSSAKILEKGLSPRLIHQYVPIDRPSEIKSFLNYWNPDIAIWVESELWPNLVNAAQRRGMAMILVQGRMSARSFRRWSRLRSLIRPLLLGFKQVLVQTPKDAVRYRALGALDPIVTGTLKYSAPPLVVDDVKLNQIVSAIADRPCWVAASVHPREFDILREVHILVRKRFPDLLTIVVPRHPSAGAGIQHIFRNDKISCAVRSRQDDITKVTEVYIGDSLGELSIFYSLSPIAFIGGSLIPHGGQNPLEAIQLGCATIVGPHMFNFAEIISDLEFGKALLSICSAEGLAQEIAKLIGSPETAKELWSKQKAVISQREHVLDEVVVRIVEEIPQPMRIAWG
jgi:3-deoxy-D-manno-octulosonic-acid transferase